MEPSDGIARVNGKGFKLTRKRFQTGTVRLREDRDPVWWEAFYREDVITESGRVKRIRKSVKLGLVKDIPSEGQAKRKLAQILVNINSDGYRPKSIITFRGFVQKYRELKMATKKGTTQHGYENNIRLHYLPHFGDWLLSEIDAEAVQRFLNLKQAAGKILEHAQEPEMGIELDLYRRGQVRLHTVQSSAGSRPPAGRDTGAGAVAKPRPTEFVDREPAGAGEHRRLAGRRGLCTTGGAGVQMD